MEELDSDFPNGIGGPGFTPEHVQLTEDPKGPATGPTYVTQGLPRSIWVVVSPEAAIQWSRSKSTRWEFENTGLVLYGQITRERLQALNLPETRNQSIRGFPQDEPPTRDEVRGHWDALQTGEREQLERFKPRRKGESAHDFYVRVAAHYPAMLRHRPGAPVQALAESAGVPHYKATNWIAEARRRELLPPAKGKR